MLNNKCNKYDMEKLLKAKKLVDDGVITKVDAANMLCISVYVYNSRVKKLEKGDSNED